MARIKIGQIGVGHAHAAGKMSVYRQSSDFEVVGVVEPDPKKRAAAQKSSVYKDLPFLTREQLLAIDGLQAVAVETEVRHLLDNAEACIKAGKHIHLDKPAGSDLMHFEKILDAAAEQHLAVQMGYMYRYNPAVLMLHTFLENGWLGDIFEVHTVMSKVVAANQRRGLAIYPGGIMFELGCHIIDLVVRILGNPQEVTPYAKQVVTDDDLADNQLAVFQYPKALATVKSTAVEVDGFARRHLVVCGTKGTFHIQPLDAPSVSFTLAEASGPYKKGRQQKVFGGYARYVGDAADLAKIIRGEKGIDYSYSHDLNVQRAVLQASGLNKSQ